MKNYGPKKQVRLNLDNCRYFSLRQAAATLDSTKKNCCRWSTDGEELKNSQKFSVGHSSVAVLFRAIKGKSLRDGWCIASGSESKNSHGLQLVVFGD